MRHNDAKNITSPFPSICVISRPLTKLIVFQKKFWIFSLYLIVMIVSFVLFFCRIQQKLEPSWRSYLFEPQNQAERNTTKKQAASSYWSATKIMLVIIWTEREFCVISDCRNSFNYKRKTWCTRRRLDRSSKCVLFWKPGVFIVLPIIRNQSRTTRNPHNFFEALNNNNSQYKNQKVSWRVRWVGDARNIRNHY